MSYETMRKEYTSSPLSGLGVKLPKEGTQKGQTLLFLYEKKGEIISKEMAEKCVFSRMKKQPKDLQSLRHLGKQDGFNILQGGQEYAGVVLKRGEYVFVGFDKPNEFWGFTRRDETGLDWESLKAKYGHACATCGASEGGKHRYTNQIVVLEKGHMDPSKPMSDDNIIPQCKDCNKVAKNDLVFDQCGRVRKMTIEGILKRQSLNDLRQLKKMLLIHKDL
tara:strand:+ start:301 stop:960 length:660 start_codon:yes stop_codon:yes gene_type:complete